ncbi:MAG: hypothetical protein KME64_28660 [Scytonematopsis contorta HA4267-MV1]|jgi:triacylglycerol esterase/lipase EstA (alpha/beta hydrolase family)|nr:hypothetical protein [Scytonematopsis contorta HA4267-MV1]
MPFNLFNRNKDNNSQPQEENTVADSQLQAKNTVTGLIGLPGYNNPSRRADIIFVHGLGGHAFNTWHPKEILNPLISQQDLDNESWLYWLGKDIKDVGVWTFGYEANFSKLNGGAMSQFDLAKYFLECLNNKRIGKERPVFFITHSLGGILVKKALLYAQEYSDIKPYLKTVRV